MIAAADVAALVYTAAAAHAGLAPSVDIAVTADNAEIE